MKGRSFTQIDVGGEKSFKGCSVWMSVEDFT
jgi:hypothetical protein